MSQLKVWIDQDLCTGDGICVELQPGIFGLHEDGLAYVNDMNNGLWIVRMEPKREDLTP